MKALVALGWTILVLTQYFRHSYDYYLIKFAEFRQYLPAVKWPP